MTPSLGKLTTVKGVSRTMLPAIALIAGAFMVELVTARQFQQNVMRRLNSRAEFDLVEYYCALGFHASTARQILETLECSLGYSAQKLQPGDLLISLVRDTTVDSELDVFWTETLVQVAKRTKTTFTVAQKCLEELAGFDVQTVDDYFKLLLRLEWPVPDRG